MREKHRRNRADPLYRADRCQLCLTKTYVSFNNFSPSWHREVGYSDARLGDGRDPPAAVRHSQVAILVNIGSYLSSGCALGLPLGPSLPPTRPQSLIYGQATANYGQATAKSHTGRNDVLSIPAVLSMVTTIRKHSRRRTVAPP